MGECIICLRIFNFLACLLRYITTSREFNLRLKGCLYLISGVVCAETSSMEDFP
jgi:hypothetical protein